MMNDTFEFSSSLSHSSAFHSGSPPAFSLSSSPYARDIYTLERDFCSNFTCCGLRLADMHELLEHFEESHVLVVAADGTPVYPRTSKTKAAEIQVPNAASSSSCSSPTMSDIRLGGYSSLVLDYPQPRPSPPPSWSPLPPSWTQGMDKELEDQEVDVMDDFDAFDTDMVPLSMSESQTGSRTQTDLLPPSLSVPGDTNRLLPRASSKLSPVASRTLKGHLLSGREGPHPRAQRHAHVRRRDKMYNCPQPGCTKTYLNLNGLKYHVEKGTCTTEKGQAVLGPAKKKTCEGAILF